MKKKKRAQSTRARMAIFALGAVILLLAALIVSVLVGTVSNSGFATEAWVDPHRICTTEWVYPEQEVNNPALVQALAEYNLPIREIIVQSERAVVTCRDDAGNGYNHHQDIWVYYVADDALLDDQEQMGAAVYVVIAALSSTEISQQWQGIDILSVRFIVEGSASIQWRMNYIQALRAYEAGLTGLELFELGIIR